MLSDQIIDTLKELKFRDDALKVFNSIVKDHNAKADLLISPNKFQPESRYKKPFGLALEVAEEAIDQVKELITDSLPDMYQHYEVEDRKPVIAVIRPTDPYEILRIMGTNAEEKHDLDTGTILARLRRWEGEYGGLELLGAGVNWIKFKIAKIPGELRDFVNEILEFAPATATEEEIRELEENIKEHQTVTIRW